MTIRPEKSRLSSQVGGRGTPRAHRRPAPAEVAPFSAICVLNSCSSHTTAPILRSKTCAFNVPLHVRSSRGHTADRAGAPQSSTTPPSAFHDSSHRRVPRGSWQAGLHQHPRARRQIGVRTMWAEAEPVSFYVVALGHDRHRLLSCVSRQTGDGRSARVSCRRSRSSRGQAKCPLASASIMSSASTTTNS